MRIGPFSLTRHTQAAPAGPPRAPVGVNGRDWERMEWPARDVTTDMAWFTGLSLIYACMKERSDTIASVVPQIWIGNTLQEDGFFADLNELPNEEMSWLEWWELLFNYHDAAGNVYLYKRRITPDSEPVWYEPLRPDWIRVIGSKGRVHGYKYGPYPASGTTIPKRDIAHFRSRDLINDYYGIGPVGVLIREAQLDRDATTFTAEWLLNKGKAPGGVLSIDGTVDNIEEGNRIKKAFQDSLSGAGDTALLEKGATYQQTSPMNSGEMPGLRVLTESRICGVFGIDGRLVSAYFAVDSSSGNTDFNVARRVFWEETVIPMMRRFETFYTRILREDFNDRAIRSPSTRASLRPCGRRDCSGLTGFSAFMRQD